MEITEILEAVYSFKAEESSGAGERRMEGVHPHVRGNPARIYKGKELLTIQMK